MKILHVVLNYYPSVGGTQWLFQNVSERLVKNHQDEVTVFTIDSYYGPEKKLYKKIHPAVEVYHGVTIKRFSFARWHLPLLRFLRKVSVKLFGHYPEWMEEKLYGPLSAPLQKAINETDADIICGSSSSYTFMHYALKRSNYQTKKPFVFMGAVHFTENEQENVLRRKTVAAIKASEAYIANTQFEKDRLVKLGVDAASVEVVGCGVDFDLYADGDGVSMRKKMGIAENEVLIAFVGRQEPFKNINILIDAIKIAWQQNEKIKLVIAGAGSWYTGQLEQLIASANKQQNKIILLTNISETEKINLFHAMDVFASASASESFGIVFVEAWACKKPVIGTRIGAIKCVVSDKEDALLVNVNDAASMSAAILQLAGDKLLRMQMGEKGYHKVKHQYTWDVVTEKYRNVYIKAQQKFTV